MKSALSVKTKVFHVLPPRLPGEDDGEYRALIDLEKIASEHQRMIEGRRGERPE